MSRATKPGSMPRSRAQRMAPTEAVHEERRMLPAKLKTDIESVVRAVTLSKPSEAMLFLGAGASVKSGIPSAWQCIWQLKQRLFLSANPTFNPAFVSDLTDPRVHVRIQNWLSSRPGVPVLGSRDEYGYYFETCYPNGEDRRRYFEQICQVDRPSVGYRALGTMLEQSHFRWLWTTNFDSLVLRGRPEGAKRPLRETGLDSATRLRSLTERDQYANLIHLHGDYRYDALKNTADEVRALDEHFVNAIGTLVTDLPLIVVGYGGADESIMTALRAAYARKGNGALYWLNFRGKEPLPEVASLIELAAAHGNYARLVESDGFDEFMLRLAHFLLPRKEHERFLTETYGASLRPSSPFALVGYPGRTGVAKSNLWEVVLPEAYWSCEAKEVKSWKHLRELLAGRPVVGGLHGGNVCALGSPSELAVALGLQRQDIKEVKFTQFDLEVGTVMHGVISDHVARALAGAEFNLARSHGSWVIYSPDDADEVRGSGGFKVTGSANVTIHFRDTTPILALVPDRHIIPPTEGEDPPESVRLTVMSELSRQWNRIFNEELGGWRTTFGLMKADRHLTLGGDDSSVLTIRPGPQFADVLSPDHNARFVPTVGPAYRVLSAVHLPEPKLRFGRGTDEHPLRGMIASGPAELALPRFEGPPLRLGVCTPSALSTSLDALLMELGGGHFNVDSRDDYLYPYEGFERTFSLGFKVGTTEGGGRVQYDPSLPSGSLVQQQDAALAHVCEAIVSAAHASASVVLVIIPTMWKGIEKIEAGGSTRDLHDHIKAFAAPRGIRTQLVREATLSKGRRLEVIWWMALALYAKSNRTPWTLDAQDDGTVHIGIGYGLDHSDTRHRVIMCCSHIFQANGLGLRFQLSEIGDPAFFRKKNPFLKRDDAFRVGARALQIVFEARQAMPRRVCIAKRTPFTREEREGFCSALEGVPELELLTVEVEDGARLVRAEQDGVGAGAFPVQRGTVVPYGSNEALVWVHGDIAGISSKYHGAHYYQGKSRIPAPLRLTRHCGATPLEELAAGLLGLSKMDWNSFDLYGKVPVHLSSPGRIARVARLLNDTHLEDRDYRLFM